MSHLRTKESKKKVKTKASSSPKYVSSGEDTLSLSLVMKIIF
jgi:hypothetical protein